MILLGDFNSDVKTEVKPGDGQAYRVVLAPGFRERAPASRSVAASTSSLRPENVGQHVRFDHKVDHIVTNAPKRIKLLSSAVTGRSKNNGYWDSDHAGLSSVLSILR